ncbi:hypothetical protein FOL47_007375 [Perkinsus chesapeaki]|uniref:Uncharacterized protein n=1 Tax=Perkinsus chesapeaki TaxID=330153 RepID=A0A7J6LKY5_PERCH|nr:hypothetical protein FOL47_007375 [Perkinsus chesapeaki]
MGKSPYCLYLNYYANDTSLALDFFMGFQDVNQRQKHAHLNISVYYSSEGSVANFAFDAASCAVVWELGVSFANLNIAVCIFGSGSGKSLLQPDKRTYSGEAAVSVSFNIQVPVLPTISITLKAGFKVKGAPHNDVTATAYLELSVGFIVVGADMGVSIVGNTVNNKINTWKFEAFFNLKVWAWLIFWSTDWTWTWPLFKAGPLTF